MRALVTVVVFGLSVMACSSEPSTLPSSDSGVDQNANAVNVWAHTPRISPRFPYRSGAVPPAERGSIEVSADDCFTDGTDHYFRVSVPETQINLPVPSLSETVLHWSGESQGQAVPSGEGILVDRAWFYGRITDQNQPKTVALIWHRAAGMNHPGEQLNINVIIPTDCAPNRRLPQLFFQSAVQYLRARAQLGQGHYHPEMVALASLLARDFGGGLGLLQPVSSYESMEVPGAFDGVQLMLRASDPASQSVQTDDTASPQGGASIPLTVLRTARARSGESVSANVGQELKVLLRQIPRESLLYIAPSLTGPSVDTALGSMIRAALEMTVAGQEVHRQIRWFGRSIHDIFGTQNIRMPAPAVFFSVEPHVYGGSDLTLVVSESQAAKKLSAMTRTLTAAGWTPLAPQDGVVQCFRTADTHRQLCLASMPSILLIGNHPEPIRLSLGLGASQSMLRAQDVSRHLAHWHSNGAGGPLLYYGHDGWERFLSPHSRIRRARYRQKAWSATRFQNLLSAWLGRSAPLNDSFDMTLAVLDFPKDGWRQRHVDGYQRFVENWRDHVRFRLHPISFTWFRSTAQHGFTALVSSMSQRSWLRKTLNQSAPRALVSAPLGLGLSLAMPTSSPFREFLAKALRSAVHRRDVDLDGVGEQLIIGLADTPGVLDNVLTFFPILSASTSGLEGLVKRRKAALSTLPLYAMLPISKSIALQKTIDRIRVSVSDHARTSLAWKRPAVYRNRTIHTLEEQLSEPGNRVSLHYAIVDDWLILSLDKAVMSRLIDLSLDHPLTPSPQSAYARFHWTNFGATDSFLRQALTALYRGYALPKIRGEWRTHSLPKTTTMPWHYFQREHHGANPYGQEWHPRWPALTHEGDEAELPLLRCNGLSVALREGAQSSESALRIDGLCEGRTQP